MNPSIWNIFTIPFEFSYEISLERVRIPRRPDPSAPVAPVPPYRKPTYMQSDSNPPNRFDPRLGLDPKLEAALLHASRKEILAYLMKKHGGRGMSKRELADVFGLTVPLVEYHLGVLQQVNLVAYVNSKAETGNAEASYVAAAVL